MKGLDLFLSTKFWDIIEEKRKKENSQIIGPLQGLYVKVTVDFGQPQNYRTPKQILSEEHEQVNYISNQRAIMGCT